MSRPANIDRALGCATSHVCEIWRNQDHSYTMFKPGLVSSEFIEDFIGEVRLVTTQDQEIMDRMLAQDYAINPDSGMAR